MPGSAILTGTSGLLLGALTLWLVFVSRRARRGTTLHAPALWSACSLALLAAVTAYEAFTPAASHSEAWRYIASVSTFCPLMALLGAKRPQNVAWQWIVGSLWGLLALPALESFVFRPGQALHVPPAWSWLIMILIALEAMNHLPTRYWPSAILALYAQRLLLIEYSPIRGLPYECWYLPAALALLVTALALVVTGFPRRNQSVVGVDRVWIDFRNSYGAAWGLRILQRLQETARTCRWDVQANWQGFTTAQGSKPLSPETESQVMQAMSSVLWRFVSPDWIAKRRSPGDAENHPDGALAFSGNSDPPGPSSP